METRILLSLATASQRRHVCARVSESATIGARTKLNRVYFLRLNAIFGYYSVCRGECAYPFGVLFLLSLQLRQLRYESATEHVELAGVARCFYSQPSRAMGRGVQRRRGMC